MSSIQFTYFRNNLVSSKKELANILYQRYQCIVPSEVPPLPEPVVPIEIMIGSKRQPQPMPVTMQNTRSLPSTTPVTAQATRPQLASGQITRTLLTTPITAQTVRPLPSTTPVTTQTPSPPLATEQIARMLFPVTPITEQTSGPLPPISPFPAQTPRPPQAPAQVPRPPQAPAQVPRPPQAPAQTPRLPPFSTLTTQTNRSSPVMSFATQVSRPLSPVTPVASHTVRLPPLSSLMVHTSRQLPLSSIATQVSRPPPTPLQATRPLPPTTPAEAQTSRLPQLSSFVALAEPVHQQPSTTAAIQQSIESQIEALIRNIWPGTTSQPKRGRGRPKKRTSVVSQTKKKEISADKRKLILTLIDKGASVKDISKNFGVSLTSVYNINKNGAAPPKKRGGVFCKKITPDISRVISDTLRNDPTTTLKELSETIKADSGVAVTPAAISKHLRGPIKKDGFPCFTVKRLFIYEESRNSFETLTKRVEYIYKYLSYEAQGVVFVFIDETPFRVMDYSSRAWSPVGQKAISWRKKRNMPLSAVTAISSMDGVIQNMFVQGSVNSDVFRLFLLDLIGILKRGQFQYTIIMDNVAFHKTQLVKELVESQGINILYTAP